MSSLAPPVVTADVRTLRWTRAQVVALLAITLLATLLRLLRIEQWSWSEAEAVTWRAITLPLAGANGFFSTSESNTPAVYLGLRWLCESGWLPSYGEGWLRLPFAFAGALAVPVLALLGRPLVGLPAALAAAVLLALHPMHLAASQSTQPLVVAVTVQLLALACWLRPMRVLAIALLVLAASSAELGFTAAVALASMRLPVRARTFLAQGTAVIAGLYCLLSLDVLAWPVVLLAGIGATCATPWRTAIGLATTVPLTIAMGFAWFGVATPIAAMVGLPGLCLFAAVGLQQMFEVARAALPGTRRLVTVAGLLPAAVTATWLAVDTFLYLTVHQGGRSPWRDVRDTVLVAANGPGGLVLGAAAGAPSLRCYLRPGHWREPLLDTNPGVAVLPFDLREPNTSLSVLSTTSAAHQLLVLRGEEVERINASVKARRRLADEYVLVRVISNPRPLGDDTLRIYRRVRPH